MHRCSFSGIDRPGLEVNRSSPSSAEVKDEWRYISAFPACLHDVDRKNLTHAYMHIFCVSMCMVSYLGSFVKLRKATVSFVMSVRPRGTTRLSLDGFFENLTPYFLISYDQ